MRTFAMLSALIAVLALNACGTQDGDDGNPAGNNGNVTGSTTGGTDAGTASSTDAGTVVTSLPAPFRTSGQYQLEVSREYVNNAECAELVGGLPGINWNSGIVMSEKRDGNYLRASYSMAAGTYEFTYVDRNCSSGRHGIWADFGQPAKLVKIPSDARKYVNCNWYDAGNHRCQKVDGAGCNLRMYIDYMGIITPAGNMANYAANQPGC